jgi:threonine/homoserine/homoserine lactone efflux protein
MVAFCLTAFILIAVPGPSVLFVVARSLTLGRSAGLASVAGNAAGVYVQVLAVAFGIGAIVERSIAVFTVIKLIGAGYLIFLGVQAIRHRRALTSVFEQGVQARTLRRLLGDAFLVGVANPKAAIFFAAILPQFVDRQAGSVPGQMIVLGAIFFVIALICDAAWALTAGAARGWLLRRPGRLELIGGAGGLAMIGIGTRLAFTGQTD